MTTPATTHASEPLPEETDNTERDIDPAQDVSQDPEVDYSISPEAAV